MVRDIQVTVKGEMGHFAPKNWGKLQRVQSPQMAIDPSELGEIVVAFSEEMTSIRSRRVQRRIKREFAAFDSVRRVRAQDGAAALLARKRNGSLAYIQTTGRAPAAGVASRPARRARASRPRTTC
jgi:hypothetical protein